MGKSRAKSSSKASKKKSLDSLKPINLNAAGIDIGADSHWVSVPPDRDEQNVREFRCYTTDIYALADWLKQCQVETVVMESTGVYWIPVFQILETRGFEVLLVNSHHVKTVPGRKSDVLDCQWLQQLHSYGLLAGSFRPRDEICVLRSYIRHRDNLIRSAGTHVQRMQKALTQMNLQLHRVISDITGKTGLKIIRAMLAGERNPETLASLKDGRIRRTSEEIAAALTGDYRAEHLFVLQQELQLYEMYQQQIAQCDQEIETYLTNLDSQVELEKIEGEKKLPPTKKYSSNTPAFDLGGHLHRISGVDFTRIDGLGVLTVQTILSEVGLDPSRFPTVKHFTSWLGLCPGSRVSGGKVKSSQTRQVVNRAANSFRMAAHALSRSQTALGAFFRRLRARLGTPKAITATAHKLARIFYCLWTKGGEYNDPGIDVYEQQYQQRVLKNLQRKADQLGFELVPLSNES
ncbi:MAG: IS110 family transposase [Xenococcaceae cyanobacterium MO_188.B32]|nr:IS110 family transposase [Xenococcaceae cyanobacterium MO_188.B32]